MKYASGKRRTSLFRSRHRAAFPASLIVLGIIVFLFWLIPASPINTSIYLFGPGFTPPPATFTSTPPPTATFAHGERIVFTCTRGDFNQLCMIKPDGTGLARVTSQGAHDYYPVFSPLGNFLAFASTRNGPFDLYILSLGDGNFIQLTHNIGNAFSPDFSPDGKQIVFANRAAHGPSSLWVMDQNGENPRQIFDGPNTIVGAAWSPDGHTIAFAMSIDDITSESQIFLFDLESQTPYPQQVSRGLLGIGGSIDWSPDGEDILIHAGAPGNKDIFRIAVPQGTYTQLTFGGNNASASYSPDGQWIAFNSLRNNDQADLFIMRFDGQLTRQLTDDPEPDWQPQWEP
jgi:Tol biopolymer transport system component